VIIVIGKMGHGKSSFIKSLMKESEDQNIMVGDGIKSVTTECELYEMKNSKEIF
jgi:GTPase SAR1 family protein